MLVDYIRPRIPAIPVRFLDQLRQHIRDAGLAYRIEQTYLYWVKRFIYFHGKRHPKDMDMGYVEVFLSHLASRRDCSPNTQRIAPNAIIYLYKRFMGIDVDKLQFTLARAQRRLPVVYSRDEIAAILSQLQGVHRLLVELMYGTGLRSAELLSLWVKDIDFGSIIFMFVTGKATKIAQLYCLSALLALFNGR